MNIIDKKIDGGRPFDWGRTSADYAKFRDIYPEKFYQKILDRNLCMAGQSVLDLGTGTGFFPEICTGMGRSGRRRIFQRTRLNRQGFFPTEWILTIMLQRRRISVSLTIPLMSSQPASAFGILTMKRSCLNYGIC